MKNHTQESVTVVCCVEAGGMEEQTIRMIESLRTFGGAWSNAGVVCVKARGGPKVSRATEARFERLDVRYFDLPEANKYPWMGWFNKLAALAKAEQVVSTDLLAWFDSDILICDDLLEMAPGPGVDIRAREEVCFSVTESDPSKEAWWKAACTAVGGDFAEFPWIDSFEGIRIRLSLQSGVVVGRLATGFAEKWRRACYTILEKGIVMDGAGIMMTDQLILAPAVMAAGLKWELLPWQYNAEVTEFKLKQEGAELLEKLKAARVMHYHEMMWPASWEHFVQVLAVSQPKVHAWIKDRGTIGDQNGFIKSAYRGLIKRRWKRDFDRYMAVTRAI